MENDTVEIEKPKRGPGRPPKVRLDNLTPEQWLAQTPCPHCHARPGYNPATGMQVRSWDAATRSYIDGHRASCKTLAVKP